MLATLSVVTKSRDVPVEVEVGETIGVVGEEDLLPLDMIADPTQALADRGVDAGLDEREAPLVDVGTEQLDLSTSFGQHEVVRRPFAVLEEELLDLKGTVSETEDEIGVAKVRVVPHQVPQHRSRTDLDQRLGDLLRVVAKPHPHPAAKQHYLHP